MQTETDAGWEEKQLGTLCELFNGYAFKPTEWKSLGKPIIRIQNLNGGTDYNFYQGVLTGQYEVNPGTLLFAWSGNRGTSFGPYIWQGPTGLLNQHIFKVIPKEGVDQGWLFYALDEVRQRVERDAHGASGLVHVKKDDLCKYRVSQPNPLEQHAIATILDTMDEAIRRTETVLAKLQQVKAGMLHDLLTRGLDENGELRDPLRHPEQFNKTPFGTIPKKWEFVPLENIAEVSSGVTLGNTPQGAGTIELPYLRVANVQDGYLDLQDIKRVRIYKKDIARFALRKGDVLMNEGGDFDKLGRGAIWEGQIEPCLHQNHVFRVRPFPNSLNSYFLDAVSSSQYGKGYFLLNSKQSTNLASINSTQLKGFPVPCPGLSEQLAIVESISAFDRRFVKEHDELLKLQQLKQGLIQDLLTGRVRVPPHLLEATS